MDEEKDNIEILFGRDGLLEISKRDDVDLVKSYGHKINETETNNYTELLEQIKENFNEIN